MGAAAAAGLHVVPKWANWGPKWPTPANANLTDVFSSVPGAPSESRSKSRNIRDQSNPWPKSVSEFAHLGLVLGGLYWVRASFKHLWGGPTMWWRKREACDVYESEWR